MHQPRPHGTLGEASSEEDAAAAELLLRRLTNFKDASGVDSLKMARTLPSGAIAIAQDAGGVLRLIIQKPPEPTATPQTDGLAKGFIPMMFSGTIDQGRVFPEQGIALKLTMQTRQRLAGYEKDAQLPPAVVRLQRFVIEHHEMVSELMPKIASTVVTTQYANQRATWYSGGMAQVMQIVGGYGKQDMKALPDDPIERARLLLPEKVRAPIEREISGLRLPGYTGLPPRDGKFQFDYKFNQTHGVGFDADGKPWLLRVNTRGVYAMPLPLVPATTTEAFREYMEEVSDTEILWILDRFGGMPSGESFPSKSDDFESWRRAGVIVKVCDAGSFYQNLMYTSAIGWSFNERGTEGFNTCYDYGSDDVGRGKAFKLSLALKPARDAGRLPEAFKPEDPDQAQRLNQYLAMLNGHLGNNGPRELAIRYKLRRVPIAAILARSERSGAGEAEYWDALEVDPIATHGGSIAQVGEGKLWHGAKPKFQPQIKFPEPFMEGCVSFDFSPARIDAVPAGQTVKCNTIMFGYYLGDQLKAAKYFLDQRTYKQDVEDNYEECMITGAWERTATAGDTSLMGNFYTTDIDEREAAAPVTTVTKTVGTDLGYDTVPMFAFDHFFSMVGTIWRNRFFQHKVNAETTEGFSKTLALCVPYLSRNAVLHAQRESTTGASKTDSLSVYSITDPNSYRYFTYDFVWAWVGGSHSGNMATAPGVSPAPNKGNPVWVTGYNYVPYQCSDFADQGDWMGGLPQDYTWLIHPNKNEWLQSGGGGPPTVREYSVTTRAPSKNEGLLQISILNQPERVNADPSLGYFTASPNDFGDVFYVDAICNVAGDTTYANTSESDPEAPKQRKRFGFTSLADHKTAHHFIGAINE